MSASPRVIQCALFLSLSAAAALAAPSKAAEAAPSQDATAPTALPVGVVQMALEPTLEGNRDKIVRFIGEAAAEGCRVVVFPESALSWPEPTPKAAIDAAIAAIQDAAKVRSIYVVFCAIYKRTEKDSPFNWLLVINPAGEIIHRYHKLWSDQRSNNVPGLFQIDGVPCAGIICADRWIRGVEDLPAVAGAKILFELSCNFADEWVPELGWYWYVPRALRNNVYVIFANTAFSPSIPEEGRHGHSAILAPDGSFLAAAQTESDRLLTAVLDLTRATGEEALRRRNHPFFRVFWETGLTIMNGGTVDVPEFQPLQSPAAKVKMAAVQMTSTDNIAANVAKMKKKIGEAKTNGADVVIFPELAVTGPSAAAISAAGAKELEAALLELQEAARAERIYVVFGMPWREKNGRRNCALVLDPEGKVLARHAQMVVDRPDLFVPGTQTRTMWFRIKGVPAVVTLGQREALWSEIAELAAVRGAQIHVHLSYDTDITTQAALLRRQLYVNLATFNTFAATVNATGETAIWEDYRRDRKRTPAGYGFYCARVLARATEGEQTLYAEQTVSRTNPHFARITGNTNPQMKDWFEMGARAIDADTPPRRTANGGE